MGIPMKKIWIKKFKDFAAAEAAEHRYYEKMTPNERVSIVQFLRDQFNKFSGKKKNARRKRLRRSIKIIQ
jgi:hypothetical protein